MNNPKNRLALAKLLWGWKPHPTQREWLLSDASVKVAACGRRWGKTEAAAIDAAAFALIGQGSRQMIVSPSYDQSCLIFTTIESLIMKNPLSAKISKVVKTPYPKITIGSSVITARTADDDGRNLRGNSADRVIVDEAAYVKEEVINEVISPMLADRNGRMVMLSTPFGKNHFYKTFIEGQNNAQARVRSFSFPSSSNPHISMEYIAGQKASLSERQFAVEYEARFTDSQSSVFSIDDIAKASQLEIEPTGCEYITAGIDWARYTDYTALIACACTQTGIKVIASERFNGLGWSEQIERAAAFLKKHRVCSVLTDQTSIGDPLLEQLRTRCYELSLDVGLEGYQFTNQSKRELIDNLAVMFSHNKISIPDQSQLLTELKYFEYQTTRFGSIRMNARSGYNDDLVCALALACFAGRDVSYSYFVPLGYGERKSIQSL